MSLAPLTPPETSRYARHIMLPEIGMAGQEKLKAAKVLVIGAGGLGCPVLQYLTAVGIGTIGLVDSDYVEESNLQRQILFSPRDTGRLKAEVAREKLEEQNPLIKLVSYPVRLNAANALSILADYDLVLDGSDNFKTRYLVNDACVLLNKPLVFGSIYKFEGQVSVFNYQGGPTYRCLYPEESELASCAEVGVLGVLPGIVGCLMANEAIKVITGIGEVTAGELLILNALNLSFQTFTFALDPQNKAITNLIPEVDSCSLPMSELSFADVIQRLKAGEKFSFVDVRQPEEFQSLNIGGQLFPLPSLSKTWEHIPNQNPVLVYCKSGVRSRQAAEFLHTKGFDQVFSLNNGIRNLRPDHLNLLRQWITKTAPV